MKKGQIAHINGNPNDNSADNLVFLCLNHHDDFDSRPSVSKGFTQKEIKSYRDKLYAQYDASAIIKKESKARSSGKKTKSINVEPFFWLAQTLVGWSTSEMELMYVQFETQAKSLSINVPLRNQIASNDYLTELLPIVNEAIAKQYSGTEAAIFGLGCLVALLPFAFKSIDDLRVAKASIEGLVLKSLNTNALIITTEFLNQLPCDIPVFVEKVEEYKKSLQEKMSFDFLG